MLVRTSFEDSFSLSFLITNHLKPLSELLQLKSTRLLRDDALCKLSFELADPRISCDEAIFLSKALANFTNDLLSERALEACFNQ